MKSTFDRMMENDSVKEKFEEEYKTWVYNKIDSQIESKIVNAEEAQELWKDGWRLSPAEFTEDEDLKYDVNFHTLCNDMANIQNVLLNIDLCEDMVVLKDVAENFLKMKVHHKIGAKKLKEKIKQKAIKEGLIEVK